jgi:type IV pilus assembly protein PilA
MKRIQQGFTLIELMIVARSSASGGGRAAGVLITPSAPRSEGILAASACRTTITEVYQSASSNAAVAAGEWGCEAANPTSRYVSKIETTALGAVTITMDNVGDTGIDTKTLTLTPYSDVGLTTVMAGIPTDAGKQVAG